MLHKNVQEINDRSAFGIIVKNQLLSINVISKSTGINRNYLQSLVYNPFLENQLSLENINKLSLILNTDKIFFLKSNFVGYYSSLWQYDKFLSLFIDNLSILFNFNRDNVYFDYRGDKKAPLKDNKYIYLTPEAAYIYHLNKLDKKIPNYLFDYLLSITVKQYKDYCFNSHLAFC